MAAFGAAPGIIVGTGVGLAASVALQPAVEIPKQEAWKASPNRILDPATLARLVAQGGILLGDAQAEAKARRSGKTRGPAVVGRARTDPTVVVGGARVRRRAGGAHEGWTAPSESTVAGRASWGDAWQRCKDLDDA